MTVPSARRRAPPATMSTHFGSDPTGRHSVRPEVGVHFELLHQKLVTALHHDEEARADQSAVTTYSAPVRSHETGIR